MAFKDVTINALPFLSSEVGLVTKTMTIPSTHANTTNVTLPDGNVRKILKAGSVVTISSAVKGILFQDVDLTDGDCPASVMVGGRVYETRVLNLSTNKTTLQGIGIIFDTLPTDNAPADTIA